jgi:hypothetical protein
MDITNLKVIRESFGRVCYSHKTHEKDAEMLTETASKVKWVNIILIGITSGTLLTTFFGGQQLLIVSAIFSALTLAFSIFQLSFDPQDEAVRHKHAANSLWLIREKYISLMTDIINLSIKQDTIVKRRDDLINELDVVYKSAPTTSGKAYKKAQKALQLDEELTFKDKEIDQLLPESLHIQKLKK